MDLQINYISPLILFQELLTIKLLFYSQYCCTESHIKYIYIQIQRQLFGVHNYNLRFIFRFKCCEINSAFSNDSSKTISILVCNTNNDLCKDINKFSVHIFILYLHQ